MESPSSNTNSLLSAGDSMVSPPSPSSPSVLGGAATGPLTTSTVTWAEPTSSTPARARTTRVTGPSSVGCHSKMAFHWPFSVWVGRVCATSTPSTTSTMLVIGVSAAARASTVVGCSSETFCSWVGLRMRTAVLPSPGTGPSITWIWRSILASVPLSLVATTVIVTAPSRSGVQFRLALKVPRPGVGHGHGLGDQGLVHEQRHPGHRLFRPGRDANLQRFVERHQIAVAQGEREDGRLPGVVPDQGQDEDDGDDGEDTQECKHKEGAGATRHGPLTGSV